MSDNLKKNVYLGEISAMNTMRVRIAPSPTGFLHIGTARTALFNFLFARKHGGTFIIRIEDTDLERSDKKFESEILESLQWLGIEADESPFSSGPYAPYRQSERLETYSALIQKLLDGEKAYWCYHTEEELEAIKNDQRARKVPEHYPGYCRNEEERERLKKRGNSGVIRFAVPSGKNVSFDDIVQGKIEFDSSLIGDFSIAKGLMTPLYNFAVVVDDYTMKISHVIRGADHISNTPRQILLAEALGFPSPIFGHLPLVLGPDHQKLSKRHGATSIREYREKGYIAEAIVNFMALIGWSPQGGEDGTNQEVFDLKELVDRFSLEKVQKAPAIFNIVKLDSLNSLHMRRLSIEELARRAIPFFVSAGILAQKDAELISVDTGEEISFDLLMRAVALEKERVKTLADFPYATEFLFRKTLRYAKDLLRWKTMKTDEEARDALKKVADALSKISQEHWTQEKVAAAVKEIAQGDNGRYFWPLRVALSGREKSPGPQEIAEVLGKTKTLQRIDEAKNLLG